MTTEESKNQIILGLNKSVIDMLVDKLAEVSVENEQLKARVAELEANLGRKSAPNQS